VPVGFSHEFTEWQFASILEDINEKGRGKISYSPMLMYKK
jgi:hypothetical protein